MTFQLQTDKNPFQFHIIFLGMNPLRHNSCARTKEVFRNWKYNERFFVRATQETDHVYHLRDFVVREDSADRVGLPNEIEEPARRMPSGHRSQSEADWAYVRRGHRTRR